jgi:xylulokinase
MLAPTPEGDPVQRQRHVLAIDLGTSGPKVAVVDAMGRTPGTARAHVDTLTQPGGIAEQDPHQIWEAVKSAAVEALAASGVGRDDIVAVICTSQYSSIVPVDRHGHPTSNMVLWQDHRGSKKDLKGVEGFPRSADNPVDLLRWIRVHGIAPIVPSISLLHMRHLKYSRPDVYARTAWLLEPMDYLTMRLTGRATANQATTFLYLMTDNRRLDITDYDPHLVRASLIDREKLPELVPMDAIVGTLLPEVADELGLSPSTRVVTGINDNHAGAMGSGAFVGRHAAVSVGSTTMILTHVDFKRTDVLHNILSMPSPVPNTYLVMAENGMAGAALERFLTNIVYGSDHFSEAAAHDRYVALQRVAGEIPAGSDGLMFLPWLSGSLAPSFGNAYMRGGFLNISTSTTRGDMARAVLEGVAQNLRWMRGPVEKFAKRTFTHYSVYGGGARSDLWCQIMADVLGAPVHQLENCDYTVSVGAGLLAFERLGDLSFDDISTLVRSRHVFDPDPRNTATYDVLHEQFVKAYKATKPIYRALNAKKGS